jgi:hypothetical protein
LLSTFKFPFFVVVAYTRLYLCQMKNDKFFLFFIFFKWVGGVYSASVSIKKEIRSARESSAQKKKIIFIIYPLLWALYKSYYYYYYLFIYFIFLFSFFYVVYNFFSFSSWKRQKSLRNSIIYTNSYYLFIFFKVGRNRQPFFFKP